VDLFGVLAGADAGLAGEQALEVEMHHLPPGLRLSLFDLGVRGMVVRELRVDGLRGVRDERRVCH
jgi:hypothetical protein